MGQIAKQKIAKDFAKLNKIFLSIIEKQGDIF